MKKVILIALAFVAIATLSQQAVSHSGGTDQWGCHVESATGIRHCH